MQGRGPEEGLSVAGTSLRRQRAKFKRILLRALEPMEAKFVLEVVRSEQHRKKVRCGHLGVGQSLINRNWLERDEHGNLQPTVNCRALWNECEP